MILYSKCTDKGNNRKINEDYCYIPDGIGPYGIGIVADGIGGYQGGEVASKLAVNVFCAMIKDAKPNDITADEVIFEAINIANDTIIDYAKENEFYAGMGTTLVAAVNLENGMKIVNIGDSRAYKYSQGLLKQISVDHSLVQELVNKKTITHKQARKHPQRNIITRALGDDTALAEIFDIEFNKNDIILLCSDGLSDMIDDEKILSIIEDNQYIEDMAEILVDSANLAGGYDNITCVLIKNTGENK
jgi:PPM family protein phosphatase